MLSGERGRAERGDRVRFPPFAFTEIRGFVPKQSYGKLYARRTLCVRGLTVKLGLAAETSRMTFTRQVAEKNWTARGARAFYQI